MCNENTDWRTEIDSLDDAALLDRWRHAIETIAGQMIEVQFRRRLFNELDDELVRRNTGAATSLVVARWLRPTYGDAQLAALRRMTVDHDSRSESLVTLLREIEHRPETLSRCSYVEAVQANMDGDYLAESDLDRVFGADNDYLPTLVLRGYRKDVTKAYARISKFVNKRIAHTDRVSVIAITWGELDEAIDDLARHVSRLHVPLLGADISPVLGLKSAWKSAFRGLFPGRATGGSES